MIHALSEVPLKWTGERREELSSGGGGDRVMGGWMGEQLLWFRLME